MIIFNVKEKDELNMKKLKGVIFDMDGVIFDTEEVYLNIWTEVFKNHGYNLKKETYIHVMGTGTKNTIDTFKAEFGDDLPIDIMYEEKDEILKKIIYSGEVPMKEGALEMLQFLKEKGIKTALATSAKEWRQKKQLELADIRKYFDEVVCKKDVTRLKPYPDIFLKAAERLSLKPEECIVIEDSPAGIEAAYNAGIFAVHVEDLKKADDTIKKFCNVNFYNMNEIKQYIEKQIAEGNWEI